MKVLNIVSTGYVAGGAENIVVKMTDSLQAKGHSVKALASDLGADKQHFNDYVFKSINSANPFTLPFFLFNPYSFMVLRKVLKDYKPDVVHLHTMHQLTPSVLFLLRSYPTVMTLHGPETFIRKLLLWCIMPPDLKYYYDNQKLNARGTLSLWFNRFQHLVYKLVIDNVDVFIAPSKYIEKAAAYDKLAPIVQLPNFIELGKFSEIQQNYNLLFVGRVEKVKGIEFVIKAMPLIINVFPQAKLTIIGDGSDKENLVQLAKDLLLEEHVRFVGWVKNEELHSYYEKASAVVVPSIWPEIFGRVILEAMSVGRPVIGTNVGGIPEVIEDGVSGYLVEPQNPEQIAEKVIQLFSEEKLLKEFGRNARKRAEEFGIEKYSDNVVKVYEDVRSKYEVKI